MRPLFEVRRVLLCESILNLKELGIDETVVSERFETTLNNAKADDPPMQ